MTNMPVTKSEHSAFREIRSETIPSLNVRVEQYEHVKTGAMHYHLAADSTENVFLVALRTVPHDSTGVAHILEHTALCGSERFPVRDPFFMMLRRSLNTFMNAFTSSDWTAYPFASQNRKDFDNLLDVYLDAVFFSRLDPLDFAQEGHRVEFEEPDNANSKLVYKGVVFNEMKGAMSSVSSTLWQTLCHHLFPTTTYHYNSGGDPAHIPDLSYEDLKTFYKSHYHPTNAIFMTFGDIPAHEHQRVFEEKALSRFDKLADRIAVQAENRLTSPQRVNEIYALDESGDVTGKTHIVVGWMLGESTDLEAMLEAQLLSSILLDNSASPLQHALETTDLGLAPSPLCGLEDSMRELVFVCGIEGSEVEHADALELLITDVITQVAQEGVPLERLEAVLHQLELHQREISGDSYPYGLQLIMQALGCATHYSDPIAVLNLDPVIDMLRERITNPDYIRELASKLLLDNPHRVTLVMSPDQTLSDQRRQAERSRLDAMKSSMDAQQQQGVIDLAQKLAERQQQEDDESILPKVELSDVPAGLPELTCQTSHDNGITLTGYGQGTNGLVYQQIVAPVVSLSSEQLSHLPYYTTMLTELGLGSDDYLATQNRQSSTVGSINAFTSIRGSVDDEQQITANIVLSSKALVRNNSAQAQLLHDTLHTVKFTELSRIRDMVSQQRARREQSVTGNGHGLAMTAASAGMSPLARLNHELSGLAGIQSIKRLDDSLKDDNALTAFAKSLADIHEQQLKAPFQILSIAEAHQLNSVEATIRGIWQQASAQHASGLALEPVREQRAEFWIANTTVNFCARAYPTVPVGHKDAAALIVLGGFLRNGFLHRTIREQGGAYGGGASQDAGIAAFRFYSYRDPRLTDTLNDFDNSIAWLLESNHENRALEEAILGVIGSMDKPSSPAGEAKQHFHNRLFGRTHEQREALRAGILAVTLDDLRRVTETYLRPELASTAVVSNSDQLADSAGMREALGMQTIEL